MRVQRYFLYDKGIRKLFSRRIKGGDTLGGNGCTIVVPNEKSLSGEIMKGLILVVARARLPDTPLRCDRDLAIVNAKRQRKAAFYFVAGARLPDTPLRCDRDKLLLWPL
jgi:hypothetical protein